MSRNLFISIVAMFVTTSVALGEDTPFGFPLLDDRSGVVEATSLLGEPLVRPTLSSEARQRLEVNLLEAWANWQANPEDEMATIWLGRRLGYLGRYNDAITVFTKGLESHPESYKLLRHRGHRYISIRKLDEAIADLDEAARIIGRDRVADEIEPDGAPNEQNTPRSTTNSNIYYHLALAHFLKGEFPRALRAHRRGLEFSENNDDQRVSTGYWFYRTLRAMGRDEEAEHFLMNGAVRQTMDVIENHAYVRLLMTYHGGFAFVEPPENLIENTVYQATFQFGIADEMLANGDVEGAIEMFERIVAMSDAWSAFGYISAEARLAQLQNRTDAE
jgi:tetratricopeptide (TPR) repeat protein